MGKVSLLLSSAGIGQKFLLCAFIVCSFCVLLNWPSTSKSIGKQDVVGCDEAKKQLMSIVNILNGSLSPRLTEKPLALVFYGPEGTGKYTVANSLAAEAGAFFLEVDAADIQSSHSVLYNIRLRSLFGSVVVFVRNADSYMKNLSQDEMMIRKSAFTPPSMILDEVDNLSQMLFNNALKPGILSWMLPSNPVVAIFSSASRLPSPAKGQFFQQIGFSAPTLKEREQLFSLKLAAVGLSAERAKEFAAMSFGLNGAEISRVCSRAALKGGDNAVGQEVLNTVLEDDEDPSGKDWQKEMTAVHEASHAVVAWMMEDGLTVDKITILPQGDALGSTQFKKRKVFTKDNVFAMICTLLAGREAESVLLGYQDSGSRRDLIMATNLAYQSVAGYGFGDFPAAFDSIQSLSRPFSSTLGNKIDLNVVELLEQASKNASQLVTTYQNEIIKVAQALLKSENLPTSKITDLLGPKRVRADLSSIANFLKKQV